MCVVSEEEIGKEGAGSDGRGELCAGQGLGKDVCASKRARDPKE